METIFSGLFEGMNQQVFNTPIDLFIENYLYTEFPELRPNQFISLFNMYQDAINGVTDKKIIELTPKDILSKNKVYNVVLAIQFKELFGIDFINDFKASPSEMKQAKDFYEEYLEYKDDKEPAEEYELVQHWAEDLGLDQNFELVSENEYRTKKTDIDGILESIEKDPFDLESPDPSKAREMEKFKKSQETMGTNMAVVMFMVDALQFFEDKPQEEIKKIAFEIAMQGTQGYRPDKKDYRISAIKGKTFSGYHILAYYYVSWALAVPDMLSQLQLPYDDEYEMAKQMHKPGSK